MSSGPTTHPVTVLLIDDQPMIGEAVRRMLADQPDVEFHFCSDATEAVPTANRVRPTVILQDLVMPDIDGLTLVKFFRVNPATRDTPLIVLSSNEEPVIKAEAFALGANDYLVKLPDKVEVIARIRYHSQGYINLLERNEAYAALAASQERLAAEMAAATKYVQSLLPPPITEPIRIDWRYVPSAELGGDSLGFHWLDSEHLAVYVFDVSGHGLGPALLGVTVMNILRSHALPNTDFHQPSQVLQALNRAFDMDSQSGKFFTIWYGVLNRATRALTWSGAGHPPAILLPSHEQSTPTPVQLDSQGPIIGMMDWPEFETGQVVIDPASRLYVYSDGVHEIHKQDGGQWPFAEFVAFLSRPPLPDVSIMDRLLEHVRSLRNSDVLDDDFSILEVQF